MARSERGSGLGRDANALMAAPVDWRLPEAPADDWMFGTGATGAEQALVWAAGILGLGWLGWLALAAPPAGWAWWHYLVAAVVLLDVAGGAVANTLGTAKRLYFGPLRQPASARARLLHSTVGFTALHLHPVLIAALYPDGRLWWGALWYLIALLGVAVVRLPPLYLTRPTAMLIFIGAMLLQTVVAAPAGWGWFVPIFLAKLVLAHAVREEPYRPAT